MKRTGLLVAALTALSAVSARAENAGRAPTLLRVDQALLASPDPLTQRILAAQVSAPDGGIVTAIAGKGGAVAYQGQGISLGLPATQVRETPKGAPLAAGEKIDAAPEPDLKDAPKNTPVRAQDQLKKMAKKKSGFDGKK